MGLPSLPTELEKGGGGGGGRYPLLALVPAPPSSKKTRPSLMLMILRRQSPLTVVNPLLFGTERATAVKRRTNGA